VFVNFSMLSTDTARACYNCYGKIGFMNGLEMNGAKPTADLEPAQNQAGVNSVKRRELALASNP
ncbi:MAG: hypothetical protein RRZ71_08800, partial [Clostridia bacterium]